MIDSNSPRRDLFFARAYYFAFLGGWGFILPFINLFFIETGLKGTQIGLMGSITGILGLIIAPLWIDGARRSHHPRRLLQLSLICAAGTYILLGWQTTFALILLIAILQTLAMSGIIPTSDALAVSTAEAGGQGYGSVRLWASISWILTVLAAGWLIDRFGFQAGFWGTGLAFSLAAMLVAFISPKHFSARSADSDQSPSSLLLTLQKFRANPALLGIGLALMLITFCNLGVNQFENVYLAQLGASKSTISLAGSVSAIDEIPSMLVIDHMIRRAGATRLLLLSFGANMLFRLIILFFPSVAAIIIVRLFGGIAVACFNIAFIGYVSAHTEPAERGTMFALLTATLAGAVGIVAGPIAGTIFDSLGVKPLYLMSVIGYVLAFIVFGLFGLSRCSMERLCQK